MLREETARHEVNVATAHRRKVDHETQVAVRKAPVNNRSELNAVKDRQHKAVLETQGDAPKAHRNKVAHATQVADRKGHRSSAMPDAVRVMRDAARAKKVVVPKARLSRPARNAVKVRRRKVDEAKNGAPPAVTKAAARATTIVAPPARHANGAAVRKSKPHLARRTLSSLTRRLSTDRQSSPVLKSAPRKPGPIGRVFFSHLGYVPAMPSRRCSQPTTSVANAATWPVYM